MHERLFQCSNGDKGPKDAQQKQTLKVVGNCDEKRSTVVKIRTSSPNK